MPDRREIEAEIGGRFIRKKRQATTKWPRLSIHRSPPPPFRPPIDAPSHRTGPHLTGFGFAGFGFGFGEARPESAAVAMGR